MNSGTEMYGYRRADGAFGIRNHVLVLSLMDNMNPAVRASALGLKGVVAICPEFGRGHIGEDKSLRERTIQGLCRNPNVGAVVLASLESRTAERVRQSIPDTCPSYAISFSECSGSNDCVMKLRLAAGQLAKSASRMERTRGSISDLRIGLECGGSDGTSGLLTNPVLGRYADDVLDMGARVIFTENTEVIGAEHLVTARMSKDDIRKRFLDSIDRLKSDISKVGWDVVHGANPVPDNVAGGLSTLEEKSIGAVAKSGSREIIGYLESGEQMPDSSGLYYMDSTPPAMESMTALAAAGASLILFSTGGGNPSGNPLVPTVKICANRSTVARMPDVIDVDLSGLLDGRGSLTAGVELLSAHIHSVVSGGLTWSEVFGFEDTAISRLGRSL